MFYLKQKILLKSLNFSILLEKLNHADRLMNFELFYRDICYLGVLFVEDLDFVKTKTKVYL